jgi:hypothetical protein
MKNLKKLRLNKKQKNTAIQAVAEQLILPLLPLKPHRSMQNP